MTVVAPTDRPKSVRNRCVIERFVANCLAEPIIEGQFSGTFSVPERGTLSIMH